MDTGSPAVSSSVPRSLPVAWPRAWPGGQPGDPGLCLRSGETGTQQAGWVPGGPCSSGPTTLAVPCLSPLHILPGYL